MRLRVNRLVQRCRQLAEQVVAVAAGDPDVDEIAGIDAGRALDEHIAVDLGRVAVASADHGITLNRIDDDRLQVAYPTDQPGFADALLVLHEAMPALFLDFLGYRAGQGVGRSAGNRRVLEAAHALELCLAQPVEQELEIFFRFAGVADDEGRADHQVGTDLAPAADPLQRILGRGRAAHGFEYPRAGVLKRNVQIRQNAAFGHQRDDPVDVGIGVDVVQPHPGLQLGQFADKVVHTGLDFPALPVVGLVARVDAVGAGVLADDQQFAHAAIDQLLGFLQHHADGPADQVAAHGRNDAEPAAMVAAPGYLEIGIVSGRQLESAGRNQVDVRVVRSRQMGVDRAEHRLGL